MSKLEERESRRRASIVGNMIEKPTEKTPGAPEAEDGQRRKAGS